MCSSLGHADTQFPYTQEHIGRKIIPHSIKQLPCKTRCTRTDKNIKISHIKESCHDLERNNIQASLLHVLRWKSSRLMLMDEAAHRMAQEAQIGEATREEPPLTAPPWCPKCKTPPAAAASASCVREAAGSKGNHEKLPYLPLPEMKNSGLSQLKLSAACGVGLGNTHDP